MVEIAVRTEELEPRARAEAWRHAMSEVFVPLGVTGLDTQRFFGELRTERLGELMVARLRSTPQRIVRHPRHITGSTPELWQVALAERGGAVVEQDGRQAELGVGDLVIYETARPFRWSFTEGWAATVFTLPRPSVGLSVAESRALTARRLPGGSGLTGVLSRFLRDLAEQGGQVPPPASRRLTDGVVDLVLALLDDRPGGGRDPRGALLIRIKDHIDRHLTDPGLTPASIAAAHHISTRHLHALFAEEPLSVARYVRQLRLRRCARELRDPRLSWLPIADIAARAGFADLRGFGRAFKSTYGCTPRDYRRGP